MLSRHKDLQIRVAEIKKIVEMLKKEEEMEALEAFITGISPYPPPPPEKSSHAPKAVPLPETAQAVEKKSEAQQPK